MGTSLISPPFPAMGAAPGAGTGHGTRSVESVVGEADQARPLPNHAR